MCISEPKFKCSLCGYASDWQLSSVKHMKEKHAQWREIVGGDSTITDNAVQHAAASSPSPAQHSASTTVHTNPRWMDEFKTDFVELIVDKCSVVTKDAFEKNDDVKVI